MGILTNDKGEPDAPEALKAGEYLRQLAGIVWDGPARGSLSEPQRRFFKRARLDFHIVQKESDDRTSRPFFKG